MDDEFYSLGNLAHLEEFPKNSGPDVSEKFVTENSKSVESGS